MGTAGRRADALWRKYTVPPRACALRHGVRLHAVGLVYLGKLGRWLLAFLISSGDPVACLLAVGTAAAAVQRDRNRVLHAYDRSVFECQIWCVWHAIWMRSLWIDHGRNGPAWMFQGQRALIYTSEVFIEPIMIPYITRLLNRPIPGDHHLRRRKRFNKNWRPVYQ